MSLVDTLLADAVKFGEDLLAEELPKLEQLAQVIGNAIDRKKALAPSFADLETRAADAVADAAEDAKFPRGAQ